MASQPELGDRLWRRLANPLAFYSRHNFDRYKAAAQARTASAEKCMLQLPISRAVLLVVRFGANAARVFLSGWHRPPLASSRRPSRTGAPNRI